MSGYNGTGTVIAFDRKPDGYLLHFMRNNLRITRVLDPDLVQRLAASFGIRDIQVPNRRSMKHLRERSSATTRPPWDS